jgi:hypothetical protein
MTTTTTSTSTAIAVTEPVFNPQERLALAGFLAHKIMSSWLAGSAYPGHALALVSSWSSQAGIMGPALLDFRPPIVIRDRTAATLEPGHPQ